MRCSGQIGVTEGEKNTEKRQNGGVKWGVGKWDGRKYRNQRGRKKMAK